jgi:hypothetical protein
MIYSDEDNFFSVEFICASDDYEIFVGVERKLIQNENNLHSKVIEKGDITVYPAIVYSFGPGGTAYLSLAHSKKQKTYWAFVLGFDSEGESEIVTTSNATSEKISNLRWGDKEVEVVKVLNLITLHGVERITNSGNKQNNVNAIVEQKDELKEKNTQAKIGTVLSSSAVQSTHKLSKKDLFINIVNDIVKRKKSLFPVLFFCFLFCFLLKKIKKKK